MDSCLLASQGRSKDMEPGLALQLTYVSGHTEDMPASNHPGHRGPVI